MLPQICSLKPHTFLASQFCGSGVGHGLAGSSPSRSHTATFKMWALRLQSHLKLNWGSISFQVLMVIGSIRFPKGFQIETLSILLASGWLLAKWAFLIWLKRFSKKCIHSYPKLLLKYSFFQLYIFMKPDFLYIFQSTTCSNRWTAEADMILQQFLIKLDIKEIFRNVKQYHSFH